MAELTEPTTSSRLVELVPSVSGVMLVQHAVSVLGGVCLGCRDERVTGHFVAGALGPLPSSDARG